MVSAHLGHPADPSRVSKADLRCHRANVVEGSNDGVGAALTILVEAALKFALRLSRSLPERLGVFAEGVRAIVDAWPASRSAATARLDAAVRLGGAEEASATLIVITGRHRCRGQPRFRLEGCSQPRRIVCISRPSLAAPRKPPCTKRADLTRASAVSPRTSLQPVQVGPPPERALVISGALSKECACEQADHQGGLNPVLGTRPWNAKARAPGKRGPSGSPRT